MMYDQYIGFLYIYYMLNYVHQHLTSCELLGEPPKIWGEIVFNLCSREMSEFGVRKSPQCSQPELVPHQETLTNPPKI